MALQIKKFCLVEANKIRKFGFGDEEILTFETEKVWLNKVSQIPSKLLNSESLSLEIQEF